MKREKNRTIAYHVAPTRNTLKTNHHHIAYYKFSCIGNKQQYKTKTLLQKRLYNIIVVIANCLVQCCFAHIVRFVDIYSYTKWEWKMVAQNWEWTEECTSHYRQAGNERKTGHFHPIPIFTFKMNSFQRMDRKSNLRWSGNRDERIRFDVFQEKAQIPNAKSIRATWSWPLMAAKCNAVLPSLSAALTFVPSHRDRYWLLWQ